jgi:hypothetical protein
MTGQFHSSLPQSVAKVPQHPFTGGRPYLQAVYLSIGCGFPALGAEPRPPVVMPPSPRGHVAIAIRVCYCRRYGQEQSVLSELQLREGRFR